MTAHPKGGLSKHESPFGQISFHGVTLSPQQQLVHSGHSQSSQLVGLKVIPTHRCVNSNKDSTTTKGHIRMTKRIFLEHQVQMVKETVPLGPTGDLLHKVIQPGLVDVADTPNT